MPGKKLVIIGTHALAEIAFEYFSYDSAYDVVAFSVHQRFITETRMCGLPVLPLETLQDQCDPDEHHAFVAIAYPELNRVRTRILDEVKAKGFGIASYVSSKAFVWRNVTMGENCFIFENNVVQPFVQIGRNVIMWSGNHIGHHTVIDDNCFIASHAVVSGYVKVGANCFLGVNCTIANNLEIAPDNWIGPHVVITKNTERGAFYRPGKSEPDTKRTAYDIGGITVEN